MWNCPLGVIYVVFMIPFLSCVTSTRRKSPDEKLKIKLYEKRMDFERRHQTEYKSRPESYNTWPEIQVYPESECKWLLQKILPRKDISGVKGVADNVQLLYKHIKDEQNNPILIKPIPSLSCRFPKRCHYGTQLTFIKSSDPNCAFIMSRLNNRSTIYYIAEEICKLGNYSKFWSTITGRTKDFAPRIRRKFNTLRPETIEKRMNIEKSHQRAFISNQDLYRRWPEIQADPMSECEWLTGKIMSSLNFSKMTGETGEISLIYKYIKDENNKPFPLWNVTSLVCRFYKKTLYGNYTTFIRSPDPACALFMNRLSSRSNTYYIAEEVCKAGTNSKFGENVLEGGRGPSTCSSILHHPDMVHEQEQYEMIHRQEYLTNPFKYQTWPELQQIDTQFYCHMMFEKFLPGTGISILDIKSERLPVELVYRRIKNENNDYYPSCKVWAFSCLIPPKFQKKLFQYIRSPKLNCFYMIRRKHSTSKQYCITKQICDQKWGIMNIDLNKEPADDFSNSSPQKHLEVYVKRNKKNFKVE